MRQHIFEPLRTPVHDALNNNNNNQGAVRLYIAVAFCYGYSTQDTQRSKILTNSVLLLWSSTTNPSHKWMVRLRKFHLVQRLHLSVDQSEDDVRENIASPAYDFSSVQQERRHIYAPNQSYKLGS